MNVSNKNDSRVIVYKELKPKFSKFVFLIAKILFVKVCFAKYISPNPPFFIYFIFSYSLIKFLSENFSSIDDKYNKSPQFKEETSTSSISIPL